MSLILGCLCAFVLGGVPFALVVVRLAKGVDVRQVGSGNVGATNASRAFTSKGGRLGAFLLIYLLDAAKGFAPTCWGPTLVAAADPVLAGTLFAAAAVLGHVFTPFLRFRGGKGVATATGGLLALDPLAVLVALGVFFAVRFATGQVFFGSLALGIGLFAASVALHLDTAFAARLPITCLCLLLAGFLFFTHRSNLQRYLAGRREARA